MSKCLTFCHFSNQQFRQETTKSLQRLFFHLASARYVSLGHVVAIDPLIDSIPESSIDCWASAVLHLTGKDVANKDQFVGVLQLSFFPALAPSESIHYACGPRTSPPSVACGFLWRPSSNFDIHLCKHLC